MSKKQLIQIGHAGEWVNPKYVTSIEPAKIYLDLSGKWDSSAVPQSGSKLWVVGNAGYGTYSICTTLSPKQVVAKLNEKQDNQTPIEVQEALAWFNDNRDDFTDQDRIAIDALTKHINKLAKVEGESA
tara:strand:+ start:90 stop:473 length:384 start_codon:yes stop_codon:yes gene_type:complete